MNAVPGSYPTTSDISALMRELGYEWSNQAQIYHTNNSLGYDYMSRRAAEKLYIHLLGKNPHSPVKFDENKSL